MSANKSSQLWLPLISFHTAKTGKTEADGWGRGGHTATTHNNTDKIFFFGLATQMFSVSQFSLIQK